VTDDFLSIFARYVALKHQLASVVDNFTDVLLGRACSKDV
jgi:hypothetical protein